MNYYPFHLGDYAAHTGHLEPMEDLAYRRLLDVYYMRDGPLPADIQITARLVRMRSFAADVEAVLNEFFVLTKTGWSHARCDNEILKMQEKLGIAEEKLGHEKTRKERYRERRAEHFAFLRERGTVPAFDIPMKELLALVFSHGQTGTLAGTQVGTHKERSGSRKNTHSPSVNMVEFDVPTSVPTSVPASVPTGVPVDGTGTSSGTAIPTPTPTPTPIKNNNTPKPPKPNAAASPDGFAEFWSKYPKKVAKPAAEKAFRAAKLNGHLPEVLADIEARMQGEDWLKQSGKYVPNPATYLNQRRWEDMAESGGTPDWIRSAV